MRFLINFDVNRKIFFIEEPHYPMISLTEMYLSSLVSLSLHLNNEEKKKPGLCIQVFYLGIHYVRLYWQTAGTCIMFNDKVKSLASVSSVFYPLYLYISPCYIKGTLLPAMALKVGLGCKSWGADSSQKGRNFQRYCADVFISSGSAHMFSHCSLGTKFERSLSKTFMLCIC